jgi:hypothetical protein
MTPFMRSVAVATASVPPDGPHVYQARCLINTLIDKVE